MAALRQQPAEGGAGSARGRRGRVLRRAPAGAVRGGCGCCLSDVTAAEEWELARQALDLVDPDSGRKPAPGDPEDVWPAGDLSIFRDLGLDERELGTILGDVDLWADEMLAAVADRIGVGEPFERAIAAPAGEAPPTDLVPPWTDFSPDRPDPVSPVSPEDDVSYFAAALSRAPDGWAAAELDLSGVADIEEITDRVRDVDGAADTALLFVEADDEYLAILRLDEGEDLRVFGSDWHAARSTPAGETSRRRGRDRRPAGADDDEDDQPGPGRRAGR